MTQTYFATRDPSIIWKAVLDCYGNSSGVLDEEHRTALNAFLNLDAVPFVMSQTAEYVYAQVKQGKNLPNGFIVLGASCAAFANLQCLPGMEGERGLGIVGALCREGGVAASPLLPHPAVEDDPEPRAEFMPPPEPVETPSQ